MKSKSDVLCAGIIVADHVCHPISHVPAAGELVTTDKMLLTIGGCAANAGVDGAVRTRIRALFDDSAARSGFVASVIGKEVGLDCPRENCGGRIVERRSRRGRVFFGCNNYPKCDFVTWYRPVAERCPSCGNPYILEKITKKDGTTLFCDHEGCGYK